MNLERFTWLEELSEDSLRMSVDTSIYSMDALFRVCYAFTDRCYLFLEPKEETPSVINVRFTRKEADHDLASLAGEFSNALIDQRVRLEIFAETKAVRELIVAQAFAEADLIDRTLSESSYIDDPKGITR
jgi:His-Xaa-Ser system protein HxsD